MAIVVRVWVVGCDADTKKPDRDWSGFPVLNDWLFAALGRRWGCGVSRWFFRHLKSGGLLPACRTLEGFTQQGVSETRHRDTPVASFVVEQAHCETCERWSVVGGAGHGLRMVPSTNKKPGLKMNQTGPVDGWVLLNGWN